MTYKKVFFGLTIGTNRWWTQEADLIRKCMEEEQRQSRSNVTSHMDLRIHRGLRIKLPGRANKENYPVNKFGTISPNGTNAHLANKQTE